MKVNNEKEMHTSIEAIEKLLNIIPKAMDVLEEYLNSGCKETRRQASIKAKKLYEEYHGRAYKNKNEEPLHEVGNWYGFENGRGCIYMIEDNEESFKAYGLDASNEWGKSCSGWFKNIWKVKLTPEEAYERLKKWFIENGYKEGVRVKCAYDGYIKSIKEFMFYEYEIRHGRFCINTKNSPGVYGWLMYKGNLAEIVEDDEPQVGDYAKFWNEESGGVEFGKVSIIKNGKYFSYDGNEYQCAKKITKEQYEEVKKIN